MLASVVVVVVVVVVGGGGAVVVVVVVVVVVGGTATNVAVTLRGWVIDTVHGLEHPDQPVNVDPAAAAADNVTDVPNV